MFDVYTYTIYISLLFTICLLTYRKFDTGNNINFYLTGNNNLSYKDIF